MSGVKIIFQILLGFHLFAFDNSSPSGYIVSRRRIKLVEK
jgi:hypothetical protein